MRKCKSCGEYILNDSIQCSRCFMFFDGVERVDQRCGCGNLVAKLTDKTVEIKCRRCKRIVVINSRSLSRRYSELKRSGPKRRQVEKYHHQPLAPASDGN